MDAGPGLEYHAALVRRLQLGDPSLPLRIVLSEGDGDPPPQGLVDLVVGDEGAGGEAGGEVRGKPGQPEGRTSRPISATMIGEAVSDVSMTLVFPTV